MSIDELAQVLTDRAHRIPQLESLLRAVASEEATGATFVELEKQLHQAVRDVQRKGFRHQKRRLIRSAYGDAKVKETVAKARSIKNQWTDYIELVERLTKDENDDI